MIPKNKNKKRFSRDSNGVSPVVGVILMVAITVVMAAIVSSWSAGVKAPTTPTTVGLDISRSGNNITITVTAIDPSSAAPIPFINSSYTNSSGITLPTFSISSANVGIQTVVATNETGPSMLVVTATFKDGSKRVLYSQST